MASMKIDKVKLLESVIKTLSDKHDILVQAALDAKEAATHDESKPEDEYDTRGLEASYLAGAQAKRVNELKEEIYILSKVDASQVSNKVEMGSVVKVLVEGDDERNFFVLPAAAGEKLSQEGYEFLVVTPNSPVGRNLMGKKVGEDFDLSVNNQTQIYEVLEVF